MDMEKAAHHVHVMPQGCPNHCNIIVKSANPRSGVVDLAKLKKLRFPRQGRVNGECGHANPARVRMRPFALSFEVARAAKISYPGPVWWNPRGLRTLGQNDVCIPLWSVFLLMMQCAITDVITRLQN